MSKENDAVANKKEKVEPTPILMSDFEAAEEIAKKLLPKHHPELVSANIVYLCRNRAQKQGGVSVPGTVIKASPLLKHAFGHKFEGDDKQPDFVMIIALDVWNDLQSNQRTALVDHLLTRFTAEEDERTGHMRYRIRPPQVQEFPEIAERHGTWNENLTALSDSFDNAKK